MVPSVGEIDAHGLVFGMCAQKLGCDVTGFLIEEFGLLVVLFQAEKPVAQAIGRLAAKGLPGDVVREVGGPRLKDVVGLFEKLARAPGVPIRCSRYAHSAMRQGKAASRLEGASR